MSTGMFSFQGDFKRRTQINLGRTTHEDRATLLRRAQEERRAREEKRRMEVAASKIQAFWRGRQDVVTAKDQIRREWDVLVSNRGGPGDLWLKATRLFPFFYDRRFDAERALHLLRELVKRKGKVNYWLRQEPNFPWVLTRVMAILLSSVGSLGILSADFDKLMVEFLGQHNSILDDLIPPPHNLYTTLACLTTNKQHSISQLLHLIALPLLPSTTNNLQKLESTYASFVSQFLSAPQILISIGANEASTLSKHLSPMLLVNATVRVSGSDTANPLSQLWILGHFLLISEISGRKSEYIKHPKYVQAITQLLRNSTRISGFISMRWSSIGMSNEEEEEEEETGDDEQTSEDVFMKDDVTQRDISSFAQFDLRIQSLLDQLATRRQIASIFATASRETAAQVANCLIAILQAFPTKRDTILMDLILIITTENPAERKDILGVLWARVQEGQLFQVAKDRKIELTQLHNLAYDVDWPALVVLVYLYSRLLLTMTDDEFFNPKREKSVIKLDDVRVLSRFLSHIVFSMWWTDKKFDQARTMGNTGVTFKQFRAIATQCLIKIYLRDSRNPFLPEGHWLMMSESADTFISVVQSEEAEREDDDSTPVHRRGIRAETRLYKRVVGKTNFATPRLNILRNVPFFIPFETRVEIFRGFIERDRMRTSVNRFNFFDAEASQQTPVARDNILLDAFRNLNTMSRTGWKSNFHIQLVDQFGLPEAGIDGGGLTKEFLTSVCSEAFAPESGLFKATPQNLLYPSTRPEWNHNDHLVMYEFVGKIVGKCLYENVLVDVEFAPFFLLRWFGRHAYWDDLPSLDRETYEGLVKLKQFQGNFEDMGLTFTIATDEDPELELIPNGRNIPVTYQNRLQYIQLVANYRLNLAMQKQTYAFVKGLSDLIDVKWLVMFNQKELQTLVGGAEGKPIDVDELKSQTVLGGYVDHDKTVEMFWEVMKEMKEADKRKVLKFVTSVERPPLLGFKELVPKFSIRKAGNDNTRLPTSSTCVNLLKLPDYQDKETLRRKLLYAINAQAGFDLS